MGYQAGSSETSIPMCQITRRHMPEDRNPDLAAVVIIKIGNTIYWDVAPCNFVDGYKRLE